MTEAIDLQMADEDDLVAVALAAAGDTDALEALIRHTSPRVWRTCAALVDPASADDLTQETYLRAVGSLHSYRGEASPTRWLLTIARRVCAEEIAGRQRSRGLESKARLQRSGPDLDATALVDLTDAIDRLPSERREAFLLTAVAGMPYAEAAAACGCAVGTIRSRVARAREELVAALADSTNHNTDTDPEGDRLPFDADVHDTDVRPARSIPRRTGVAVLALTCALGAGTLSACSHSGHPKTSSSAATTAAAAGTASAHLGSLTITGGYIPQPASPDVAAAYFTVLNAGSRADVLERVTTNVTSSVMAMNETDEGTTGAMTDLPKVTVPAHGSYQFSQGHAHLMLQHPARTLRQGDKVRMTITFERAGTVTITMPVVPLTGPTVDAPSTGAMSGMSGMSGMSSGG